MAGIFGGLFNYNKPGPGVSKDEPQKKSFFRFMEIYFRKFWKLISINMLYFLCCIPIVTIGPATAGFTYVMRNFAREQHAFLWMDFRDAFKENWKQGALFSIIELVVILLGYVNFSFYSSLLDQGGLYMVPFFIMVLAYVIFFMMTLYVYPLMVTFELKFTALLKNSFIFAILGIFRNILLLALFVGVVVLFIFQPIIMIILTPFLLLSTGGLVTNYVIYPVIKKYMIDPLEKKDEPEKLDAAADDGDEYDDDEYDGDEYEDDDEYEDEDDEDGPIFHDRLELEETTRKQKKKK